MSLHYVKERPLERADAIQCYVPSGTCIFKLALQACMLYGPTFTD